jgi:type I restriction enzyme S subunit
VSDESLPPGWAQIEIEDSLLPYPNGKRIRQGWSPQCEDHPAKSHDEWAVLRTSAIQDGSFVDAENKKLPESLEPRPHLEVQVGDILITCAGPRSRCGVTCLVRATRPRLLISGKMYQLRANPGLIEQHFLELFLRESGTRKKIDAMKTGISDSGLNLTHDRFRTLSIPLPPLAEQKRIVAKIEELFSELEAGQESLRVARRQLGVYRQSLLKQAFEGKLTAQWRTQNPAKLESPAHLLARIQSARQSPTGPEASSRRSRKGAAEIALENRLVDSLPRLPESWQWTALGNLVHLITKGSSPKWQGFDYTDNTNGVLFVTSENVRTGYLDLSRPKYLGLGFNEIQPASVLKEGDVLLNIVGASIGRAAVFNRTTLANINQAVSVIRPTIYLDRAFLTYHLNSSRTYQLVTSKAVDVARANFSLADVNEIPVPLCSLPEQLEIVRLLDAQFEVIERNERELDAALKRSEALRQAILKKAFTGRLVPQVATDEPASTLLARLRTERAAAPASKRKPTLQP